MDKLEEFFDDHETGLMVGLKAIGGVLGLIIGIALFVLKCLIFAFCFFLVASLF